MTPEGRGGLRPLSNGPLPPHPLQEGAGGGSCLVISFLFGQYLLLLLPTEGGSGPVLSLSIYSKCSVLHASWLNTSIGHDIFLSTIHTYLSDFSDDHGIAKANDSNRIEVAQNEDEVDVGIARQRVILPLDGAPESGSLVHVGAEADEGSARYDHWDAPGIHCGEMATITY